MIFSSLSGVLSDRASKNLGEIVFARSSAGLPICCESTLFKCGGSAKPLISVVDQGSICPFENCCMYDDCVDGKSVESKVPTPHPSPSASHRCTRMFIPGWSTSQILPSPLQSVSDSIHAELNDSAGPGSDWRPPNPPRWNSKSSGRSGISLLNRLPALPERLEPVRWPAEG